MWGSCVVLFHVTMEKKDAEPVALPLHSARCHREPVCMCARACACALACVLVCARAWSRAWSRARVCAPALELDIHPSIRESTRKPVRRLAQSHRPLLLSHLL